MGLQVVTQLLEDLVFLTHIYEVFQHHLHSAFTMITKVHYSLNLLILSLAHVPCVFGFN